MASAGNPRLVRREMDQWAPRRAQRISTIFAKREGLHRFYLPRSLRGHGSFSPEGRGADIAFLVGDNHVPSGGKDHSRGMGSSVLCEQISARKGQFGAMVSSTPRQQVIIDNLLHRCKTTTMTPTTHTFSSEWFPSRGLQVSGSLPIPGR